MKVAHIGYPKTGSSFLQKNVFTNIINLSLIDFKLGKEFSHTLIRQGAFFRVNEAYDNFPFLRNDNIILSYEGLVGNQVTGQGINSSSLPLNLKSVGFEKIIITLRRDKNKWIESLYFQYVKMGGKLNYDEFLLNPSRLDGEYTCFHPEMIDFCDENINLFKNVFGENNVLILFLEDFGSDSFISSLSEFFETNISLDNTSKKINEKLNPLQIWILRITNNFTHSRISPSSSLRWLSNNRILRLLTYFSSKSTGKK